MTAARRPQKPRAPRPSRAVTKALPRPEAPPLREVEFQRRVTDLAKWCGWRIYHTLNSRGSQAGFPDLVMVRGERLIFAELKTERGYVSVYQREWLEALRGVTEQVEVYLWRPADMEEIRKVLAT